MTENTTNKGPREKKIPVGDDKERLTCPDCEFILYDNPKVVVGSVVEHEGKIILCKRAIEPSKGKWALPNGFLENDETTEEGAIREALEEAELNIEITGLLGVFNLPHVNQVQLVYRARMLDDHYAAAHETEDVQLFSWDEIPWKDLAFPSVEMSLQYWHSKQDIPNNNYAPLRAISHMPLKD